MNLKNLKIGTQLQLGFAAMLLFVMSLGVTAYLQTDKIHLQTETIYNHPFQVRIALGNLHSDILKMCLGNKDLMLAKNYKERQDAVQLMELSAADAFRQFNVMNERYLGPRKDIDEAYRAFISWNTAREENVKLALSGEIEKVKENILSTGIVGVYREQMLTKIQIIDNFATNKAETLYASSNALKDLLNKHLILLVIAILLFSVLINYLLMRNIRKPIKKLTDAAKRFHNGDRNARSSYKSKNEFGVLSASFNALAANIQMNMDLDEKSAKIIRLMMKEDDAKKFFQTTLNSLANYTGSQMAVVYLLSNDKKTFEHFESIGIEDNARQSFAADSFEGEFGSALSSRKVQHIKNIPENTHFVFHSVSGKFIPHEIITIPILVGNEVIAIISLASVSMNEKHSIQLIDYILDTLCTRVEGILAYRKIKEFSEKLEQQNNELEAQKTELATQSAELTEQNAELEMQKKLLHEASRLKTNFLSNMSHELRTPLNSVIALSGVLSRRLEKKIPIEEYSYLEVIERNGKNLLLLINDILDISRIEAGHEEIEVIRFNMSILISEVISMIHSQAQQKKIELVYEEGDTDLFIASDRDKCHHVLQNLISNAVKFTEKGKVEISAMKSSNNISITVSDTGIGISEKHLPYIFDVFRQADGSTSRRFGGTGLGLAIAQKYANLLAGSISVQSIPDIGSAFTFTLPLRFAVENRMTDEEAKIGFYQPIKHATSKPASGLLHKTILLVEDSELVVIQMKDILEYSGYQLLVACNGGEALGIISQAIPDAIILDLMMPGIDGFEVLKILREAEPTAHIPVLILTAKNITKDELQFLKRNNVHQLIQKGDVNRNELLNAVASMVFPETVGRVNQEQKTQTIKGRPLVLVVEDNPDNMIAVKAMLADNYTVIEAMDGLTGIEMAKNHHPDLILMDIGLPGVDGIEAFKSIRKDVKLQHIPVIALTASAMTSDRETILAHGLEAYIAKPIDEKVFFKTINEVLYGK